MKLTWFEVSNFHSVVNSGKINIEELMVLVGKNQAGKSSILQGLEYLSFTTSTKAHSELTTINGINSNYEDESTESRELPIVTANFHLEKNELEELTKNFSKTFSDKMESNDPFEKFIISLMDQSTIKVQNESAIEPEPDSENEMPESAITKIEYVIEKTLDHTKFAELIIGNFENIVIQKFVDGEYSIIVNDEEYFFRNPIITISEFESVGKKIWQENHADFDRAPNNQFVEEFNSLVDPLYFFNFKNLFLLNSSTLLKNLLSKVLEEPLKVKLTANQSSISNLFKNISISRQFHVLVSEIYQNMPKIFYFTNYQRLEDSLTLTELVDNPSKHITFVNFLKLAGIKTDYLKTNKDKVVRLKQYLTKRSGEVSEKIQRVYKQEQVDFVIDFQNDLVMVFTCYPPNITNLLPPSAGSAGFQWYIGFYINFASHTDSKYQNAILLLDDPGVLLHPSGHKDLLNELKDYIDKNITIIYSTHLPSLIPKDNFSAIRVVKKENMQTEIIENFWKLDKFDSWSPVRSALGVDFADSLFAGSKTLMVEGPADIIYIQGFREMIEKESKKEKMDLFIIPLEGVTKANFYITLFNSQNIPFVALLDDDQQYVDVPKAKTILINPKNKTRSDQNTFEIEDLLEPEVISRALNLVCPEELNEKDLIAELKKNSTTDTFTLLENFKSKHKISTKLDKVILAKSVIRYMKINSKAHSDTIENFEDMFTKILKKIK